MKSHCSDCGSPCKIEFPGKTLPEVCPFPDEAGAHFCDWKVIVDRRNVKKE